MCAMSAIINEQSSDAYTVHRHGRTWMHKCYSLHPSWGEKGHSSSSGNYMENPPFLLSSFQKLIPAVEFLDLGHNFLSLVENLQVSILRTIVMLIF